MIIKLKSKTEELQDFFGNLRNGQLFQCRSHIYIKVRNYHEDPSAFNLSQNITASFDKDTICKLLEGELTYWNANNES